MLANVVTGRDAYVAKRCPFNDVSPI
ncbi:protein of unknown function [Burkholderia multivorans]